MFCGSPFVAAKIPGNQDSTSKHAHENFLGLVGVFYR